MPLFCGRCGIDVSEDACTFARGDRYYCVTCVGYLYRGGHLHKPDPKLGDKPTSVQWNL